MENTDAKLDQKSLVDKPTSSPELETSNPPKEVDGHKITYDFFFAPHASPKDLEGLKERFDNADIYIPEASGWKQEELDILKAIANGDIDVMQEIPGEEDRSPGFRWDIRFMRMIYNSHKPIAFADVPQAESQELEVKLNWSGNFSDMLDSVRNSSKSFLDWSEKRNAYIMEHIGPKITEILKEYPNLKEKKDIKVLLSLGLGHDSIYIDLKNKRGKAVRFFNQSSPIFFLRDEGSRMLRFGKKIDDGLAAKIFLEGILVGSFGKDMDKLTEDTMKHIRLDRRIINEFNFYEIEAAFKAIKSGQDSRSVMEVMLSKKRIKIPQSENELDEFLAKPSQSK